MPYAVAYKSVSLNKSQELLAAKTNVTTLEIAYTASLSSLAM